MTLKEMVYPLVVVDKSAACAANADYELTIADLQEWEQEHGTIPEGAFVAFRSDWSKRADMNNYDENNQPHYPGWKLDALHWLVEERRIGAIGHETADTDAPGANVNFAGEVYILETDRLQVELMTNLDALPPTGAVIFVTFPKVKKRRRLPSAGLCRLPKRITPSEEEMVSAISFFCPLATRADSPSQNLNYFSKSIDKTSISAYNNRVLATIAQLAEHLIRNERVVGSNPISGSNKNQASEKSGAYFFCRVPQKVPHFIFYFYILFAKSHHSITISSNTMMAFLCQYR